VLCAAIVLGIKEKSNSSKSLAFLTHILIEGSRYQCQTLINSGAEQTFIDQQWAKEFLPDVEYPPQLVKAIDGHNVTLYSQRNLEVEITDYAGNIQIYQLAAEAVNMIKYNLILGIDWLEAVNPDINWTNLAWHYRIESYDGENKPNIKLISAAAAVEEL
jgi:hypothetical protein